jgi:hypothetical protein
MSPPSAALPGRIAVEFFGPTHFIWGTRHVTGPVRFISHSCTRLHTHALMQTAFRERQLHAFGWRMRTLSFLNWVPVHSRPEAQHELVAGLVLADHA